MGVDEAIRTAIGLETRIRDLYAKAAAQAVDPAVKRTLGVLADDEQHHLDYLEARLAEWTRAGAVTDAALRTTVPTRAAVAEGVKAARGRLQLREAERHGLLAVLQAAQQAELETASFYERMVASLPGTAQAMFARFVEIEHGHLALVSAEFDSVTRLGYWFDVMEFRLEAE
jgi:rubrerythrin